MKVTSLKAVFVITILLNTRLTTVKAVRSIAHKPQIMEHKQDLVPLTIKYGNFSESFHNQDMPFQYPIKVQRSGRVLSFPEKSQIGPELPVDNHQEQDFIAWQSLVKQQQQKEVETLTNNQKQLSHFSPTPFPIKYHREFQSEIPPLSTRKQDLSAVSNQMEDVPSRADINQEVNHIILKNNHQRKETPFMADVIHDQEPYLFANNHNMHNPPTLSEILQEQHSFTEKHHQHNYTPSVENAQYQHTHLPFKLRQQQGLATSAATDSKQKDHLTPAQNRQANRPATWSNPPSVPWTDDPPASVGTGLLPILYLLAPLVVTAMLMPIGATLITAIAMIRSHHQLKGPSYKSLPFPKDGDIAPVYKMMEKNLLDVWSKLDEAISKYASTAPNRGGKF